MKSQGHMSPKSNKFNSSAERIPTKLRYVNHWSAVFSSAGWVYHISSPKWCLTVCIRLLTLVPKLVEDKTECGLTPHSAHHRSFRRPSTNR